MMRGSPRSLALTLLLPQLLLAAHLLLSDPDVSPLLTGGVVGLVLTTLIALAAYIGGRPRALLAVPIGCAVLVGLAQPEPFVARYMALSLLLPSILAMVFGSSRWVVGCAVLTYGLALLRAQGLGIYLSLDTLLVYIACVIGLLLSRLALDATAAALAAAEERFRIAFQSSPVGITLTSLPEGRYIDANPAYLAMIGYTRAEAVGRTTHDLGLWVDEAERAALLARLAEGPVSDSLTHIRARDGRLRVLRATLSQIVLDGRPVALGSVQDVTEHAAAEQARRRSEARFATAFDASPLGMVLLAADGTYLDANGAYLRMLGYTRDEVIGRRLGELPHRMDDDAAAALAQALGASAPLRSLPVRVVTRANETRAFLITQEPIALEGNPGALAILHDVTDEQRALAEAATSEARLSEVIGSAMDAIVSVDGDHRILLWNAAAERIFGVTAAEALNTPLDRFLPKRVRERHRGLLRDYAGAGGAPRLLTGRDAITARRASGEEFPIEASISMVETDGQARFTIILRDISERAAAEAALRESGERVRESEALYRLLAENTGDIVALYDRDGRCMYMSPSVQGILGFAAEDVIGHPLLDCIHADDRAVLAQQLARLGAGGRGAPAGAAPPMLIRARHAGGGWRALEVDLTEVRWREAPHVLLAARDVTARQALEAQLMQAQRLEGVGRLAGGIAHDFNNLLAAILGYAELAAAALPKGSPAVDDLGEIRRAGERAAALTRQLLAFARKQVISPKVLRLNDLVLNLDGMLRRLIGEDIELVVLPGDNLPAVRVDPGQIEQVIINLVVNARDAMPDGGKITIQTETVPAVHVPDLKPEPGAESATYAVLSVVDTGSGMSPEVLARAFDPFFTTKSVGQGTGLGLATCYGIVQQHAGAITICSEEGVGTTVRVYLPAIDAALEVMSQDDLAGHYAPPVPGTTVLLVEDEPAVRTMAARVLRGQGYTVLEAEHGAEALEVLRACPTQPDLLLADVVMPRIGGKALAEQIGPRLPDMKWLFMSGYPGFVTPPAGATRINYLQKPFTPATLVAHVRAALGEK